MNTTNKKINKINNTVEFKKPTVDELVTYFRLKKLTPEQALHEAEKFIDYYDAVDWLVGKEKEKMSNWKKVAIGWNNRREDRENTKRNEPKDLDFESTGYS